MHLTYTPKFTNNCQNMHFFSKSDTHYNMPHQYLQFCWPVCLPHNICDAAWQQTMSLFSCRLLCFCACIHVNAFAFWGPQRTRQDGTAGGGLRRRRKRDSREREMGKRRQRNCQMEWRGCKHSQSRKLDRSFFLNKAGSTGSATIPSFYPGNNYYSLGLSILIYLLPSFHDFLFLPVFSFYFYFFVHSSRSWSFFFLPSNCCFVGLCESPSHCVFVW